MSETPQSDRLLAVHGESQAIGEFLDWLFREKEIVLARWLSHEHDDEGCYDEGGFKTCTLSVIESNLTLQPMGIERLLAEYFRVDLDAVDRERRATLDKLKEKE